MSQKVVEIKSTNFLATDKDILTFCYCVFISSHYRYRCQWERNQNLNVCVSQSSRSVWVPRPGQLCSFPLAPFTASAQFLVNCSASFLLLRSHCSLSQMQPLLYLLIYLLLFNEPHHCLKAWCRFMNTVFMDHAHVEVCCCCCCICAHWPGQEWL